LLEPEYVDDPFSTQDKFWVITNAPKKELLLLALFTCGRSSQFKSPNERASWTRAAKRPDAWIVNCIDWASGKNKGFRPVIKFGALLSLINNQARFEEWRDKNVPQKSAEEKRSATAEMDTPGEVSRG
jgi:hypothetical protein